MKRKEGQRPLTEGPAKPHDRPTLAPEFPTLQWTHVIYDHGENESDLEHDLEDAPPPLGAKALHNALKGE